MNPTVITVTRGAQTESWHRGAIAVVGPDLEVVATLGDVARAIFPRSAIKPLQAMPLVMSGAADRFQMTPRDLAFACASHSGLPDQASHARDLLTRAGLDATALACGAHWPSDAEAARALAIDGDTPDRTHNNCSGKHAGMVFEAIHAGAPVAGYHRADHPVQLAIRDALADLGDVALEAAQPGIDGCGAPNWPLPTLAVARAYAKFATGAGLDEHRAAAARRIREACMAHPDRVAGPGRFDTDVIAAMDGRGLTKTGAEGVYGCALPGLGLGIALKIDDGATRAAEATMAALLEALMPDLAPVLAPHRLVRNWAGDVVGRIMPTPELSELAAQLAGRRLP